MRLFDTLLEKLLRYAARKTDLPAKFAESDYLGVNPDVAYAVAKGLVRSGADHWLSSGAREGRRLSASDGRVLPPGFDESAYLAANPDVAIAVRQGVFPSGASHWLTVGHKDGRAYRKTGPDTANQAWPLEDWERVAAAENADSLAAWGLRPGDLDHGGFDAAAYAKRYRDIADLLGDTPERLSRHWHEQGFLEGRTPFGYRPYRNRKLGPRYWEKQDGISFFGFLDANTGLGQSARNYLAAIRNTSLKLDCYTIVDREGRFDVPGWTSIATERDRGGRNKVNIFHINADMVHRFFLDDRAEILDYAYNIGIWFWELPSFPEGWASAFGAFDEIWVATAFVRRSIASVAPIPVVRVPMVVSERPASEPLPRSCFDIPEDVFIFACIFDVGSVIERKNPAAAIRAFKQAFGDRDDVLLVMKYHGGHHYPESLAALRGEAGASRNIRFLERDLSEQEMQAFRLAIDCLVSPHRSEGFGLNIAEAMLAGTPVIATGFSGNMDFMTATNSHLIDYDLRELGRPHGPYSAEFIWAQPKIDDLVVRMRSVHEDQKTAAEKARAARDDILAKYNVDTVSHSILNRLQELQVFSPLPRFVETWGRGLDGRTDFHPDFAPRISVIVAVCGVEGRVLHRCVRSVLKQTYARWELVLHDDETASLDTARYLERLRGTDFRIKVPPRFPDHDASRTDEGAIELTSGAFVALLDSRDALTPNALSDVMTAILTDPRADLIYVGDGETDPISAHEGASPHLMVVRRALLLQAGNFRGSFSVAGNRDLAASLEQAAREIVHIPMGLRYRRDADNF